MTLPIHLHRSTTSRRSAGTLISKLHSTSSRTPSWQREPFSSSTLHGMCAWQSLNRQIVARQQLHPCSCKSQTVLPSRSVCTISQRRG